MSIEDTCPGPAPDAPAIPIFVPPCCECEQCGDCRFDPDVTVNFTWAVTDDEGCSPFPSGTESNIPFYGHEGDYYIWRYAEYAEPTGEAGVDKIVQVQYNCLTNQWTAYVGRDTPINQVELWHFEVTDSNCAGTCAGATLTLTPDVHCSQFVPGASGTATITTNATETTCQPVDCCTGTLTVTISGFLNGSDSVADCIECVDLNDVLVLDNVSDCRWEVGDSVDGAIIAADKGDWVLTYITSKCGGGSMSWRAPRTTTCPPATGWTCFGATEEIMDGCDVGTTSNPVVTVG